MRRLRTGCLLLILLFVTSWALGCSGSPTKPDSDLTKRQLPAHFKHIPADTPYVLSGMEPIPLDVLDTFYGKMAESYERMLEKAGDVTVDEYDSSSTRIIVALMGEMRGNLSREGLKSMGFSLRPHTAIYGLGMFPVMRVELDDPRAFEAFISRVEAEAAVTIPRGELDNVGYRLVDFDQIMMAIAVVDNELIVGIAPRQAFDAFLPYVLGTRLPEQSLATDNRLGALIDAYDFKPFGAGYLDIEQLVATALSQGVEGSVTKEMWDAMDVTMTRRSPECEAELLSMAKAAPRIIFGYEELSRTMMDMTWGWELGNDLGSRISATRAPIPAYESMFSEDLLATVGVGVDLSKSLDLVSELALEIEAAPFVCAELSFLNVAAQQLQFSSAQLPSFLSGIMGLTVLLKDLALEEESVDGVALLHTSDPAGLLSMVQMFVPAMQGFALAADGVPAALPNVLDDMLKAPHLAMTPEMLGLSVGIGMQDEMAALLEQPSTKPTPMMVFSYDYARLMQRILAGIDSHDPEFDEILGALLGTMGQLRVIVDADHRGVFIRYQAQLNPE